MGASASTPVAQSHISEKHAPASNRRSASSPTSAADLLAQLSLRTSAAGGAPRSSPGVTSDNIAAWGDAFASNPKHRLASTVLSKANLTETLVRRDAQIHAKQVYNVKLSTEGNPVTNQKSSGRCWLFASTKCVSSLLSRPRPCPRTLAVVVSSCACSRTDSGDAPTYSYLRIMLARKLDLDEFQLSQSYLFFYDSLSKANFFLESMLDLAETPIDDRTVKYLMTEPENDGGQWGASPLLSSPFPSCARAPLL